MTFSKRPGLIRATLLLTSTLTVMTGATISPSLPQISQVFAHVPQVDLLVKLILTMPAILIALGAPAAGYIVDRFGRIRLLVLSIAFYAVAGTTGFYLDELWQILVGRALLGLSVAGIMTTCATLVGDYMEGEARNSFLSKQGAFMAGGGVVYVALGGALADISWRAPFAIYASSLLFLPLVLYVLYEPERSKPTSAEPTTAFAERRSLLPLLILVYSMCVLGLVIFYMIPVQIPFLIKELSDQGNWLIGATISLTMAFGAIGSVLYKYLKQRMHYQHIYAVSFAVQAIGYIWISLTSTYAQLLPGLLLGGLGAGLLLPNASLWLVNASPMAIRGKVLGGMTSAMFLGQFLSPIVLQPVIAVSSLQESFLWVGLFMLLLPIGLLLLPTRLTEPSPLPRHA